MIFDIELGLGNVFTVIVTIVFVYVLGKDFFKSSPKKRPVSASPAAATADTKEQKAEPTKTTNEEAEVKKEVKKETLETESKKPKEVPPTPKKEEKEEEENTSVNEKKDDLEDLLEEAFDRLDTEENIVDQAWDNVIYGREVSLKVNVMDQIKESHQKAVREENERSAAVASEKSAEERRLEQATSIRKEGNTAFGKQNYLSAIRHYSAAIRLFPAGHFELYLLYGNRSVANREAGNIPEALKDAESCIKINPDFAKGHIRKAAALEASCDWGTAKSIYQHILTKFTTASDVVSRNVSTAGIKRCDEKLDDLLNC